MSPSAQQVRHPAVPWAAPSVQEATTLSLWLRCQRHRVVLTQAEGPESAPLPPAGSPSPLRLTSVGPDVFLATPAEEAPHEDITGCHQQLRV